MSLTATPGLPFGRLGQKGQTMERGKKSIDRKRKNGKVSACGFSIYLVKLEKANSVMTKHLGDDKSKSSDDDRVSR